MGLFKFVSKVEIWVIDKDLESAKKALNDVENKLDVAAGYRFSDVEPEITEAETKRRLAKVLDLVSSVDEYNMRWGHDTEIGKESEILDDAYQILQGGKSRWGNSND